MPTPDSKPVSIPNPIESGKKGGLRYPGGAGDPRHPVPDDPSKAKGYFIPDHGDPAKRGQMIPLPSTQRWEESV